MKAFIDSDILIWHLRGERKALEFLKTIQDDSAFELWTGVMQRAEVVFFMKPEEEESTKLFLSRFRTLPVDQMIIDSAASIFRIWNQTHGTDVNDAILAASVAHAGGVIYTLNIKHYPMRDIAVKKAW
jgi:predicted nucleic acid-binding protein